MMEGSRAVSFVSVVILLWTHVSLEDNAFSKIAKVNLQYGEYKDKGNFWQIDMKIPSGYNKKRRLPRAATSERNRLWPGGVIPYLLAENIKRRSEHLNLLKGAMREWEKKTCIRFKERTDQENYVEFVYESGCNSDVGIMNTGRQTTSLGNGCGDHGIMVHEIGHLLGLYHEQNRPDRDDYVLINTSNIIPSYGYAFQKKDKEDIDSRKVPYDYYSVMHYGSHDFSKNKKPTIVSKKEGITHFGNDKVSNLDAKVVNLMYGCPELIKFPNDFQWKAYGLSRFNDPSDCIRVNEPSDHFSWDNNFLCRRPGKIRIGLEWSNNGPIDGMSCIKADAPSMYGKYSWNDNYWCWPKDSVYKFTWLTRTPKRSIRHQCIRINEPRDRLFSRRNYYLCGKKDESPVDGQWSAWSDWSRCTRQCGGGFHRRVRACNNPPPSYGGKYCTGQNFMTGSCGTQSCDKWPVFPDDFTYKEYDLPPSDRICLRTFERFDFYRWANNLFCTPDHLKDPLFEWSDVGAKPGMHCVRIYNPVESRRIRETWNDNYLCAPKDSPYKFKFSRNGPIKSLGCLKWFPKKNRGWENNYLCAEGKSVGRTQVSSGGNSPVPGGWSDWTDWSSCTRSCDGGYRKRHRSCTDPSPQNGGPWCPGTDFHTRRCNVQGCVIDGKWSDWIPWTKCTKSCGGGEQQRRRTCSNPAPKNGGKVCQGVDILRRKCNENPCAIHGGWSQWSWWGRCSRTCALGIQLRSRTCTNPVPRDGGRMCFGSNGETRTCNNGPCPINGAWSRWSSWGACSKMCSGGVQIRRRTCNNPRARFGGRDCLGLDKQERRCNTQSCRVDGGWARWTAWRACSKSCGGGVQKRMRTCTNPVPRYGGRRCYGRDIQEQRCQTRACPQRWVHGAWSSWMAWQPCSKSCDRGVQKRARTCTNPKPQRGGRACPGIASQQRWCNTASCPIDGRWSQWSPWRRCTRSCGGGTQRRVRACTSPRPQNGGKNCVGKSSDVRRCNTNRCRTRVDGRWSSWSLWRKCSASCGDGTQQRMRRCDNPKPAFGGRNCYGPSLQARKCSVRSCPRDGQWSRWSSWKSCSRSCGGGIQQRTRGCNNPPPAYGGRKCFGQALESRQCNRQSCIVDGGWSSWSQWRTCNRKCGGGLTRRIRSCSNPKPSYGGRSCPGRSYEIKRCNTSPCRVDGRWSFWSRWRACSRSCGGGIQQRMRSCTNPSPRNGGRQCAGYAYQTKPCNTQLCRIDGKWSPWSSWRSCNQRCGGGVQGRIRTCTNPPPSNGGRSCRGRRREKRRCNSQPCRIDGKWSVWSAWGQCSASCNGGYARRQRTCTAPPPSNGGRQCIGPRRDTRICNTQTCSAQWTNWGRWSSCSASCGGGTQKRTRRCLNRCTEARVQKRVCNTARCRARCGGNLTGSIGKITSPRYPRYYPNNALCTWTITVPDGFVVKLRFNFFYVENGDKCPNDYVEIRDGSSQSSLLLGRFCGMSKPETQLSSRTSLWVRFQSNPYYNYNGFEAVWSSAKRRSIISAASKKVKGIFNANTQCGGNIERSFGRLSSPGYPSPYKPNLDCTWIIKVSKGRIIQFNFVDVDIDDRGYCGYDYVGLRDGKERLSPSLGRYCANRKPRRHLSKTTSNYLRIRLKSDGSIQGRGFSMWWTSYFKYRASKPARRNAAGMTCPYHWKSLAEGDRLYCYSLRKPYQTWRQAFLKCRQLGSELASVNSQREQDFITYYVLNDNFGWMGLNNFRQKGNWTWLDGSVAKYTHWARGEPNNGGVLQNENCALMKRNGRWNDYPCDFRFKFVCKIQYEGYLKKT